MIHDVLLSCLSFYSNRLPMEDFLISNVVSDFMHPGEKKILQDIIEVMNSLLKSFKFAKIYGSNYSAVHNTKIVDTEEPLQPGLYLKAFANGVATALSSFFDDVAELERRYLQNPTQSLLFIYQQLQVYEPLGLYLRRMIRGIRAQKIHGCAIIRYLHDHLQHGDKQIARAMKIIISSINEVFLRQVTQWVLYAKHADNYSEFFIQSHEARNNSGQETNKEVLDGSTTKQTSTTLSESMNTYADIWHFEIFYEYLPHYLSHVWAEKVLFIGQTVLIFSMQSNDKFAHVWNDGEKLTDFNTETSLWNGNENIFFNKIQSLQNGVDADTTSFERVIDEIKRYVTMRLCEIAVNEADLEHQLKLIKDFYLLGRGELFLEFIRRTYNISRETNSENKALDYVKAFESAAHSVGISDELEQFSISIPRSSADADETTEFGFMQHVQLQYKINWPLHLLFSPRVLERYNLLFRFLLLIKKMQYELHELWCQQTRDSKSQLQNMRVMNLRNLLMFFVDNLQYYIQVDVLESQFSILLNTIHNKADFEQIQRAHSVFQANVLSLCFLLADEDVNRASMLQSTTLNSNNPVHLILNDIFHLCEDFCTALELNVSNDEENESINQLEHRFEILVEQLQNLLLKASPSATSLSQFILRLDFNHWFSTRKRADVE